MSENIVKTVDVALLLENEWLVLIERAKPPFENKLVLPGGHVEPRESLRAAAWRETEEELGVSLRQYPNFLTVLASPNRDPRGAYVSTVFVAHIDVEQLRKMKAGSDAKTVHLVRLSEIRPEMIGFDHYEAIELLKNKR